MVVVSSAFCSNPPTAMMKSYISIAASSSSSSSGLLIAKVTHHHGHSSASFSFSSSQEFSSFSLIGGYRNRRAVRRCRHSRAPPVSPLAIAPEPGVPERDMVLDFGCHKGRRLGAVPSRYLKWMSRELGVGVLSDWSERAKTVLKDPVYEDRLIWEKAQRMMAEGSPRRQTRQSPKPDILQALRDLGLDLDDKEAWNRINYDLLGTSFGKRLPRKKAPPKLRSSLTPSSSSSSSSSRKSPEMDSAATGTTSPKLVSLREELQRRIELKKKKATATLGRKRVTAAAATAEKNRSPRSTSASASTLFPGRDVLLGEIRSTEKK